MKHLLLAFALLSIVSPSAPGQPAAAHEIFGDGFETGGVCMWSEFTISASIVTITSFAGGTESDVLDGAAKTRHLIAFHDQPDGRGSAFAIVATSLRVRHEVEFSVMDVGGDLLVASITVASPIN